MHEIERKGADAGATSLTVGNACLVVSAPHVRSDVFQGMVQVEGERVSSDDVASVVDSARNMPLPKDRQVLDMADQEYSVDSLDGILNPVGMYGRVLKLHTMHIHADALRIGDAKTAAANAHLEIKDAYFAATCAAEAVLGPRERKEGTVLVDLGGGCTGYAAYIDGYCAAAGSFGVGGDHITNDIAIAFNLSQNDAEEIKRSYGTAVVGTRDGKIPVKGKSPLMESRNVPAHALDTVVDARVREIFRLVRGELAEAGLMHRLGAGAVLVGGGAALAGIEAAAKREFGMRAIVPEKLLVTGLSDVQRPESFASIAGAVAIAASQEQPKSLFDSFIGRWFK